jgi:hypothetical protein
VSAGAKGLEISAEFLDEVKSLRKKIERMLKNK